MGLDPAEEAWKIREGEKFARWENAIERLRDDLDNALNEKNVPMRSQLALSAVSSFLCRIDLGSRCMRLIDPIRRFLKDVETGATNDLFLRNVPQNRPPASDEIRHEMLTTALAMDAFMAKGMNEEQAARNAAKLFRDRSVPLSLNQNQSEWRYIRNWRRRIRSGNAGSDLKERYNNMDQWWEKVWWQNEEFVRNFPEVLPLIWEKTKI